jgi:hypothetical protein
VAGSFGMSSTRNDLSLANNQSRFSLPASVETRMKFRQFCSAAVKVAAVVALCTMVAYGKHDDYCKKSPRTRALCLRW